MGDSSRSSSPNFQPSAPSPQPPAYDALLIVSFGGPDKSDDVLPFLEKVLCGRNVPRARMLEVAEHYYQFGGRSPINEQNRQLVAALERELAEHGPPLPIYWGNRNWHPLLPDTLRQMAADGVRRALAFVTSAYSSYSGCRQYREDIARAQLEVGSVAPHVDKLRVFYNHPGFIEPMIERTRAAFEQIPPGRRARAALLFTAHSIPSSMAAGCPYEEQFRESCRLVAEGLFDSLSLRERAGVRANWRLVYQSRSGPPQQPWLEPDVNNVLRALHKSEDRIEDVVVVPIGFISDHMEVLYDLDTEAHQVCDELGLNMVRVGTVGTHPRFVQMIRELIVERMSTSPERLAMGTLGANHDVCPEDCCLYAPQRPTTC
jgi:protoporphyrin/coproporphyrin ferrochelatase